MELGPLIDVGRTSDVHAFGDDAVVKVPKPDVPGHWAEVEFALSDIVHRHGLPAPAARSIVVLDGRPCVVFDRVDGPTMWQTMVDDPSTVEQMAGQLAQLQHRIHCAGPPEGVPDLVARTVAKVAGCPALSPTDRADVSSALAELAQGAALLHGDLHPGNVIFGPDGPVVIDWFDAAVGHPVADIARSSLLMRADIAARECCHLPGATADLLDRLHTAYLAAWVGLGQDLVPEFEQWRSIAAISRATEGADPDPDQLLDFWRQRPIPVS